MYLRYLFLFFLIILNNIVHGQISDVVFLGTAILKGGDAYSYKLLVNDSNGIVRGYSVTDVMGPNETKTAIKGTINTSKKHLNFRETRIIYTKSSSSTEDFCYIHGSVKLTKIQGATSLTGTFKGYKEDGKTECASGRLILVCAQEALDKLLNMAQKDSLQHPKKDTVSKAPKNVSIVYEKEVPESEVKRVLPGNTIELSCPSPSVSIEIWDSKTIDNDRVTITLNDKTILENYAITGTHKLLSTTLENSRENRLTITPLNEGDEPLNTARMKFTCGGQEHYIDAVTKMGKNVTVILKR